MCMACLFYSVAQVLGLISFFSVLLNFGGYLEYSLVPVWESLFSDKSSQLYSLCEFARELFILMKMPLKWDRSTLGSMFVRL